MICFRFCVDIDETEFRKIVCGKDNSVQSIYKTYQKLE